MSERKLGVAVYGAGWVSTEHLKAFRRNPHCEVVAVGSRRESSAREKAAMAGCDCSVLGFFTEFDDLLAHPGVDAVSICTPNHLHVEEAVKAAAAGKHFIVEKPIALTLDSLRELRDAVAAAGVRTVVSFVLHWNPSFLNTKRLLEEGAIGEIFYAECDYWHEISDWYGGWEWVRTRASGGSTFLAAGCHAVDALLWFVGSPITEVAAFSGGWDKRYEYPATEVAIVKFASGAVGKLSSSFDCQLPYSFNVDLLGDKGTIRDNRLWAPRLLPGASGWTTIPSILPDSGDVEHHPFEGEIDHFVDCVLGGVESEVSVANTFHAHEVCLAMDMSADRGGEVVKLPLA